MAIKFGIDRVVVLSLGGDYWGWLSYWQPLAVGDGRDVPGYALPLLLLALPFLVMGVLLTVRRLRDAGRPLWLVALFFVPAINVVLFTLLSLLPSRDQPGPLGAMRGPLGWVVQRLALQNRAASAAFSALLTVLLVVPMTWLATVYFHNYGWGVFVGMPFVLGLVSAVVYGAVEPRTLSACFGISLLALWFCVVLIIALAIEGIVCLLMAAPLAIPIVLLGAGVGYCLQIRRWGGQTVGVTRVYSVGWIALPLLVAGESWAPSDPQVIPAVTSIDIAASPLEVWREVVAFSELPPPEELIFRSGIAYPIRATISGTGVGAVRRCEFSTGAFVEPITVWDEGKQLAFDVIEQPHPMHELSPYRNLHPAHLDGFFRSQRGEFLLIALPDGGTRLQGTTWYTQRFWPAGYWRLWSDHLLHSIHRRVLNHIRTKVEATARG